MQMITPDEARHIERIVERAQAVQQQTRTTVQFTKAAPMAILDHRAQLVALIAGCHLHAVRMDLRKWAKAPTMQLMHDFHIIRYHYNPTTERLETDKRPLFTAPPRPIIIDEADADLFGPEYGPMHPGLADLAGNTDDDGEDDQ